MLLKSSEFFEVNFRSYYVRCLKKKPWLGNPYMLVAIRSLPVWGRVPKLRRVRIRGKREREFEELLCSPQDGVS